MRRIAACIRTRDVPGYDRRVVVRILDLLAIESKSCEPVPEGVGGDALQPEGSLSLGLCRRRRWLYKLGEVLQDSGLSIGGRAQVMTQVMLAEAKYKQPKLIQTALGDVQNPRQIESGKNLRAGLEDGSIDAAGGYKIPTLCWHSFPF